MSIALVATVGADDANSFVSEDEAEAYLDARLNAGAWTPGGDAARLALIEATREIGGLRFAGYRTDAVQALSWPRTGVPDPDAAAGATLGELTGLPEYADDAIPQRVKDATIELALEFLRAGTVDIAGADGERGVIRKRVDVLETEWAKGARPAGLSRFPRVIARLAPLLSGAGRELVRS
jgi:hypothetical protein